MIMTDDELIFRLKQLKKLEPPQNTLAVLASRIKAGQLRPAFGLRESLSRFLKSLRVLPVFAVVALAVFILIISATTSRNILIGRSQMAFTKIRMVLASNRYQQARLALNLSQNQLNSLQNGGPANLNNQLAYLSDSIGQTDASLRSLRLSGEPGKYTKQQCLETYEAYSDYLGNLNNALRGNMTTAADKSTQIKLQFLLDKSSQYEQDAHAKLKMY